MNAANKAANIYANYLETSEAKQIKIYQEVAERCEALQKVDPKNANAFYSHASNRSRPSRRSPAGL